MRKFYFNLLYLFTEPPWDTGVSPPELHDFIEKHAPGRTIDIGCGTGTNVIALARAGWQVTGVDFAPHAVKIAKRKVKKAGIQAEILERDAAQLNGISGPFDLALDIGCFHGMRDRKADYLSELERVLAPGGFWLMYGFFKSDPASNDPGLVEADLELIPASMTQVWRQDGLEREERPSAWFLYQKTK